MSADFDSVWAQERAGMVDSCAPRGAGNRGAGCWPRYSSAKRQWTLQLEAARRMRLPERSASLTAAGMSPFIHVAARS